MSARLPPIPLKKKEKPYNMLFPGFVVQTLSLFLYHSYWKAREKRCQGLAIALYDFFSIM